MKNINYYLLGGLLVLVLCSVGVSQLLLRGQAEGALRLEVYQDGKLSDTIVLINDSPAQFTMVSEEGRYNIIDIDHDRVRVESAECPNQICVNSGWISQSGQMVICAPNKLVLLIKGKKGQVDAIVH